MPNDLYNSIDAPSEGLYKEKGSKFLAFAYPVATVDEAMAHVDQLRKQYFDARHHCFAYSIGADRQLYRSYDDGEPSGTGGRPIYGQILSKEVSDVLVVVVRYFGGVLLGASGLANAYKVAARDALDNARLVQRTVTRRFALHFAYPLMNEVMRLLKEQGLSPLGQGYDDNGCVIDVAVRLSAVERFGGAVALLRGVTVEEKAD